MHQIHDRLVIWRSTKQNAISWPIQEHNKKKVIEQLRMSLKDEMRDPVEHLFFMNQVHGSDGLAVDSKNNHELFLHAVDFCTTKAPYNGLAIVTADCVPLVLYDSRQKRIAAIHAGWRGSIAGIVSNAVDVLIKQGSTAENLYAFFGPAARGCCYEIDGALLATLRMHVWADQILIKIDKKTHLDLVTYNTLTLKSLGIPADQILLNQAVCTMCNHQYSSYRRQGLQAGRNVTIAYLR